MSPTCKSNSYSELAGYAIVQRNFCFGLACVGGGRDGDGPGVGLAGAGAARREANIRFEAADVEVDDEEDVVGSINSAKSSSHLMRSSGFALGFFSGVVAVGDTFTGCSIGESPLIS